MEITICTKNKDKLIEIKAFLKSTNITFKQIPNNINLDVIEDGDTFISNATKKALTYAKELNVVVLADDSGLCVNALNGLPGIHSQRYSGKGSLENNKKLLKELENKNDRTAYFVTVLCVAFPNGKTFIYEGRWNGKIASNVLDFNGFGYDPLFIPNESNEVVSKLGLEFKLKYSHRSNALREMLEGIDEIIDYWRYSRSI